ncbi:MAG: LysM peptidoglycan-binding domain-containing protein [Acidobacteriaceae bacterium]|jgi:nucleoid-associated protein YgaU|nr:LysM peptidoglycan-binding domain-containing protein [Acidobacteriaceae bacterium]
MDRFEQLKAKYKPVLDLIPELHIKLNNLHVENDKLVLRAHAPAQDQVNDMWNKIKAIDPAYGDLAAEITIDASLPPVPKRYTVVAGDSLWKIAAQHLGNGSKYPEIIKANPGKLKDDKSVIHPGDVLIIPNL